jgi:predicted nucleic acid-binding protein
MTTVTATIGSEPVVLDSSGWLEFLTLDTKADSFAHYLEGNATILIPTVVLYEVRKVLLLKEGKTAADIFFSEALRRIIVPFDEPVALLATKLSIDHKLSMADSIIYATAQHHQAQLITSDAHFTNLPGVTVL